MPAYKPVVAGEMIATVKIIPFGVAKAARDAALAGAKTPLLRVAPYRIRKVGVVSTLLPGLATKVIEKTLKITAERLAPAGAAIVAERRVPHERAALAKALDEVLKAGAELADRIRRFRHRRPSRRHPGGARGHRRHGRAFRHAGRSRQSDDDRRRRTAVPVIGAPGCARSPKENGFDWVLMRLLAGLPVPREDITGLGVGGLLMEIVTRPQPRDEPVHPSGTHTSPPSCSAPADRAAWAAPTSFSPRSTASR